MKPFFPKIATEIVERCCARVSDHEALPDLELDLTLAFCGALQNAYDAGRNLSVMHTR